MSGAELIPGDTAAIFARAAHYRDVASRAAERAATARRASAVDWEGETADAFRLAVTEHRRRCRDEEEGFRTAAEALEAFAGQLRWAQRRADEAAHDWARAQATTAAARAAHSELLRRATRGTLAGAAVVIVSPFVDPGHAERVQAERSVADARRAVTEAEAELVRVIDACAVIAPTSPLFGEGSAGRPAVRSASAAMPLPGPASTLGQIVAWLSAGAYTVGELLAVCTPALVLTAITLVVIPGVGAGSTAVDSAADTQKRRLREATARMWALTHFPDGALRPAVGTTPIGHEGLLAVEDGPATADEVKEILDAKTRPGKNRPHREVDAPEEQADLYEELVQGGVPVETADSYAGTTWVELPDGTRIGLREGSRSGGPTIDIRFPEVKTPTKVHLPEGWGKSDQ